MSRIELAVEKVKRLDENQAEALLEWLAVRETTDPGQLCRTAGLDWSPIAYQ